MYLVPPNRYSAKRGCGLGCLELFRGGASVADSGLFPPGGQAEVWSCVGAALTFYASRFTFHAVVWTLVSKPQDAIAAGDETLQFLLR